MHDDRPGTANAARAVLEVTDLRVSYGAFEAVRGVSFSVAPGEVFGLIGESGSGKSTVAYAILNYVAGGGVSTGRIVVDGLDVLSMDKRQLQSLRGSDVAIVHQEPMSSLNPSIRLGEQIAEVLRRHQGMDRRTARRVALELIEKVEIKNAAEIARRYPHQVSGGQQQRIVIAMALACNPSVLVMDEPTTGLDVTTEAAILALIKQIQKDRGLTVLVISHDLKVIQEMCDRVAVMRNGEIVETGRTGDILGRPRHDYTRVLVNSSLMLRESEGRKSSSHEGDPILSVRNVSVSHDAFSFWRKRTVRASVRQVDFDVYRGRTLGIVGESGSGKSTLAQTIAGLLQPIEGSILFEGEPLPGRAEQRSRQAQRKIQLIFQNPDGALDPRHAIRTILSRPLHLYKRAQASDWPRHIKKLLEAVRLPASYADKYPRELSGGEKQRVNIARAFAAEPDLVICDEPTSSLDVSVQASILEQLLELQEKTKTSVIFISHDLGVVQHLAHDVAVMFQGEIVEMSDARSLFSNPQHPYTKKLLNAAKLSTAV